MLLALVSIGAFLEMPKSFLYTIGIVYVLYTFFFILLWWYSKNNPFNAFLIGLIIVGLLFLSSLSSGAGILAIAKTFIYAIFLGNGIKSANKMKTNQKKNDIIIDDIEF